MQDYINKKCPICDKPFSEGDDIVVCPECGTPHHRECYNNNAGCANEYQHGEFEWGAESIPKSDSTDCRICENCGKENPIESRYCSSCGAPLSSQNQKKEPKISFSFVSESDYMNEKKQALENILNNEEFDGVSAKETAIAVRSNIDYFLFRFLGFSKGRKFDTNISAFLFSYFYVFYRKMYALGIGVLLVSTVLSLPSLLIDFQVIQEVYVEAGLLSQVVWNVPHMDSLNNYAMVAGILLWGVRILLLFFFNRLYYSHINGVVKKAKAELTDDDNCIVEQQYIDTLRRKGGTSMAIPIILIVCSFLVSIAIAVFLVSSPYFIFPTV